MCIHGNTRTVHLGGVRYADVDSCISDIVEALNEAWIETVASCCGHGHLPPSIVLKDGREIRIVSFEQARALDTLIGVDIHGNKL